MRIQREIYALFAKLAFYFVLCLGRKSQATLIFGNVFGNNFHILVFAERVILLHYKADRLNANSNALH